MISKGLPCTWLALDYPDEGQAWGKKAGNQIYFLVKTIYYKMFKDYCNSKEETQKLLILPDFKTYNKATRIKIVWEW